MLYLISLNILITCLLDNVWILANNKQNTNSCLACLSGNREPIQDVWFIHEPLAV